jgi:hypothetical protein
VSKSLEELQYKNAKIENDVNTGCAIVSLVFAGIVVAFVATLFILAL